MPHKNRTQRTVDAVEIGAHINRPAWQILGDRLSAVAMHVLASAPIGLWCDDDDDESDRPGYDVTPEGVAVINVCGTLIHSEPAWWMPYLGYISTPALARTIAAAAADGNVRKIYLGIDSPGGHQSGIYAVCDAIWAASHTAGKPVWASGRGLMCSAAYEIASQCDKVFLAEDGMAGCIGTVIVLSDWSAFYNQGGVVNHRITSTGGEVYKGQGARGTKVTSAQLADFKRMADECQSLFNRLIQRGRGLTAAQVATLADGRSHVGRNAMALGLVDAIATPDEVLAAMGTDAETCGSTDPPPSDEEPDNPPPADSNRRPKGHVTDSADAEPAALSNDPQPEQGRKETRMPSFKDVLFNALESFKLGGIAVKVLAKNSDDPNVLAATVAGEVEAEVTRRVEENELFRACRAVGITSAADLDAMIEMKALGDNALKEMRDEAKALANIAYGPEEGPKIGATVNAMSAANVRIQLEGWRAEADIKRRAGPNGEAATRQTQPQQNGASLPVDDVKEPETNWEQLSGAQQAHGTKMGFTTKEQREAYAASVLGKAKV